MRLPVRRALPGAVELPGARRRREQAERRTVMLGVAALGTTLWVIGSEVVRVYRRRAGDERPTDAVEALEAAEETARQAVEVAVAGYRAGSTRENALLNLLVSFSLTFAIARASTHTIRRRGHVGPFKDLVVGQRHIHHFVPGIVLAFLAGGASVVSRNEELDPYLALPFGVGVALTLDESALLLKLDDVYWTEEGIVSVQVTLAAMLMLSALAVALKVLRRGEREVLEQGEADERDDDAALVAVPAA
ncbi:hypothetical protein [Conexibacter sp. SYSU D00693]|uniref:hypothetical protein n=1 Tax=Conexibacter sp. SYSU D00693 TaxID=2812560 RepID=UPI00196B9374|nr:hypothetical protein [Conexibacter sp. SYSU D00693]